MRTVLAGEVALSQEETSEHYVKLEVQNGSGTWIDVGKALGSDWIVNATFNEHIDTPIAQATFTLALKVGDASLAPLMIASVLNVDDADDYAPLLNIGRLVRVSTATMARGVTLDVSKYRKQFDGRIDDVQLREDSEGHGTVVLPCSDLGAWLMDMQIRTEGVEYGNEDTPPALLTVLQNVLDAQIPSGEPAVTVVKSSGSSFAVTTWNQGATKTLEALRTLVLDSVGEDLRYRYDSSHISQLMWFDPDRTRVTVDATFTADQYTVQSLDLSLRNIRNVGEMPYTDAATGLTGVVTSINTESAAATMYRERFFRLPESRLLTTEAEAQTVLDIVTDDVAFPPAEAIIHVPYCWWVQLYDRYTFEANNRQYDEDQTFAVVGYQKVIENGRGSTALTVTARVVGAYAEWQRRISGAVKPEMRVVNFREVSRTATTVTIGWESSGVISQFWLYLSTPSQPVGTDPYLALRGVPTARLTAATTSYEVTVPRQGLVTYGRLIPMSSSAQRGHAWDFTVQPGTAERLIQRATVTATDAETVTVSVAVANPTTGSDILITPAAVGCSVAEGAQTILAANVTDNLGTTGTKTFTITRPAFQTGSGRVTFTATSDDRLPDIDAVDVPAQEQEGTIYSECRARITDSDDTTVEVTVDGIAAVGTPTVHLVALTGSATINSGAAVGATGQASGSVWVFDRGAFQAGPGQAQFRATTVGAESDDDFAEIPEQGRDTVPLQMRARVTASDATTATVRVAVADPYPQGADSATITYTETGGTGTACSPASGGTVTPAATLTEAASTYIDYTVTRPNFGTGTRRVTFTATASGRTSDSDAVDVPAVEQDSFGPSLTVTVTPGASSYSIAWSGDAVTLSIDGAAYGAPPASPITVNRNAANGADKIYSFNATLDGQTISDVVIVPAVARDFGTDPIITTEIDDDSISTPKLQANSVEAGNINVSTLSAISADMGTITAGKIDVGSIEINAATERILFGAATAPTTGTGIFLGKDGSDYEFRVGDPSGQNMHWDGSTLTVTTAGITAATAVAKKYRAPHVAFSPQADHVGDDFSQDLTGAGLILIAAGTRTFLAPVILPQGVTITALRMTFKRTNASGAMSVSFRRYEPGGDTPTNIATVTQAAGGADLAVVTLSATGLTELSDDRFYFLFLTLTHSCSFYYATVEYTMPTYDKTM